MATRAMSCLGANILRGIVEGICKTNGKPVRKELEVKSEGQRTSSDTAAL